MDGFMIYQLQILRITDSFWFIKMLKRLKEIIYYQIINIGILPIIIFLSLCGFNKKLNPDERSYSQTKIFALLPFVETFVLEGFAAGLVLYWSVEQYFVNCSTMDFIQRKILAIINN